jgi:tetratricopeptide (TPR) repeat protein
MKIGFSILLICLFTSAFAQNNKALYGAWVKVNMCYNDGREYPDDNMLKFAFLKYNFASNNEVNFTTTYDIAGNSNLYDIDNDYLVIKSPQGGLINSFRFKIKHDTLTLVQQGLAGDAEADLIRYTLVREKDYQNVLPLQPADFDGLSGGDTVYRESPKLYAVYDGATFQGDIYAGINDKISMDNREGHLLASFIVNKKGVADSVKIIDGVDDEFNKRFFKVFAHDRNDWKPAMLHGKPVAVRMWVELRYSTSAIVMPGFSAERNATRAYKNNDYQTALFYFDKLLTIKPWDQDALLKRGMCKMHLGNPQMARQDWESAMLLRSNVTTNEIGLLIAKYCK